MSRSAVREIQISGLDIRRGEVVVPTMIGDPVHGQLSCHAAPLVAGSLLARGGRVRMAELPRCDDPAADFDGMLYLATCPQDDGTTAAIAAASAPGDALGAAAARTAVEEWAGAGGTRTLLLASSPWCPGALHAASAARHSAVEYGASGRTVYVLTPAAMPPETVTALTEAGAIITSSLADVRAGDVVVFPAHGVTAEQRAEAARRGATMVDGTCPLVGAAQTAAARSAERGQQLVVIGQPGQASTEPIVSQAPGYVSVVETPAKTAALRLRNSQHVSYLMQPGIAVEAAAAVATALRSRYPALRPAVPSEVCYAPSDRAGTVRSVAVASDVMLVLGDPQSADTRLICGYARDTGTRVQVIADVIDIRSAMLAGVHTIGMAESTSASAGLAARVLSALAGLGRLSVVRRKLTSDKTAASLA